MATGSARLFYSPIQLQDRNPNPNSISVSRVSTQCSSSSAGEQRSSPEVTGKRKLDLSAKAFSLSASHALSSRMADIGGVVEVDLSSLWENIASAVANLKPTKLQFQMLIEKAIVDCRFFAFFAVAGSLLGSVLCYLEGCLMIMESYFCYLRLVSHRPDQGHILHLVIEAIDMFLMGTAMLVFGVGLYAMFVGSRSHGEDRKASSLPGSSLFGLFHLKKVPSWLEMESVAEAKSRIGHAVMMILQVGVLEKVKSVPLVTAVDLACFAGTILVTSACVFVLSKLSFGAKDSMIL